MRLLIVTTQDRFFLTHICDRALYFQSLGWEVGVAVQVTDYRYSRKIKKLGFTLFDTKIERQSLNPFIEISRLITLIKFYKVYKPSVVWHLGVKAIGYGTVAALFLRRMRQVGIVNSPIGLGFVFASNSVKARLVRPIVKIIYKVLLNPRNSKVIVENPDDISSFITAGALSPADAYCILGAGVDTSQFKPLIKKKKKELCTVMMASRLIKEKGVWDFVKAAELLSEMNIPVRMVLVGEPDYGNPSSLSKAEFEKLKKNPALECWGFKANMSSTLVQADIFCLPSYYREGLPRVLIEAASCGLAIVTTDTIGCREVIRNKNGFLFQPRDVNKLVQLICFLVFNPNEVVAMGERSRLVALTYFDKTLICRETFNVFKLVCEEYSHKPGTVDEVKIEKS